VQLRELRLKYEPTEITTEIYLENPKDAIACVQGRLEPEAVEVCLVLLLNTKHRVIGVHELSRGTIDQCTCQPRDMIKLALLANAGAIIVAHNHPSGIPDPSPDDLALLERTRAACSLMGITLLDFSIIGHGRYYSAKEGGRL
jgi:DNA repair protein RadC